MIFDDHVYQTYTLPYHDQLIRHLSSPHASSLSRKELSRVGLYLEVLYRLRNIARQNRMGAGFDWLDFRPLARLKKHYMSTYPVLNLLV